MTRPHLQRSLLRITLTIDQPWAVGGVSTYNFVEPAAGVDDETPADLPILVDPRGASPRPYVPATSLVGALRQHLGDDAEKWFGPRSADPNRPPEVSPLRALGTTAYGSTRADVRVTTAVDPERRAAKRRTLRAEGIIEASPEEPTTIVWWLQLDARRPGLAVEDLAAAVISWRPWIGRRRGVGRGRAEVVEAGYATLDLNLPDHLTWWLEHRHGWLIAPQSGLAPPGWRLSDLTDRPAQMPLVVEQNFVVADPLHLGDGGFDYPDSDSEGRIARTRRLVPGSSWRGIFRHRVAHIQRVSGVPPADIKATTRRLFGSGRATGQSNDAGGRGTLIFEDSPIAIPESGLPTFTHVAIDRVTGGARHFTNEEDQRTHGALFTVQAVPHDTEVGLRIRSTSPLDEADQRLLRAVVRDIGEGIVGVGGLTSRGYGTLRFPSEPRTVSA